MKDDLFPVVRDEHARSVQRIECKTCGAHDQNTVTHNGRAGNDTMVSYFRKRGWNVDPRHEMHSCPECVRKMTEAARNEKATLKVEKKQLSIVSDTSPSPNSALAKKIMSDLLFDNYDLGAQDYKPGWDDARIAKESGMSEAFVAQRRAADYGPVSPPRKAVVRECAGMAAKIRLLAREVSEQAGVLKQRSDSLLMEADRLATLLSTEAEKLKASA